MLTRKTECDIINRSVWLVDMEGELKVERKLIQSTRMCKELLLLGFRIVDISPNKMNKDRTVFIFELTKELEEYLTNREGGQLSDANPNENQTIQSKERSKGHQKEFSQVYIR